MLVLDTDNLSDFCKTLEVLGPEHSEVRARGSEKHNLIRTEDKEETT